MTAVEAAEAARRIEPGVAVPMHWGTVIGSEGRRRHSPARRRSRRVDVEILERTWVRRRMSGNANGMQQSLLRMAREEPELAARCSSQALPAAAAGVKGRLNYELIVDDVGPYNVSIDDGAVERRLGRDGGAERRGRTS